MRKEGGLQHLEEVWQMVDLHIHGDDLRGADREEGGVVVEDPREGPRPVDGDREDG